MLRDTTSPAFISSLTSPAAATASDIQAAYILAPLTTMMNTENNDLSFLSFVLLQLHYSVVISLR
jgi:hypothetical protein